MEYKDITLSAEDIVLLKQSLSVTAEEYGQLPEERKTLGTLKRHILSRDIISRLDKLLDELPERDISEAEESLTE